MRRRVVVRHVFQYAAPALGLVAVQRGAHVLASGRGRMLGRIEHAEDLVASAEAAMDAALAPARIRVCLGIMHGLRHVAGAAYRL